MITIEKGCEAVTFRESVYGVGPTDSLLGSGELYLQRSGLRWSGGRNLQLSL